MGFISKWRDLSEYLYDKYGQHLQAKYDKYRNLESPIWFINATETIWDRLDTATKEFLTNFVKEALEKFNEDYARKLVEKLVGIFKKEK